MPQKIWVTVKLQARKESFTGGADGTYQVSVRAPPAGGKANLALIELLAGHLSVPKSKIKILSGRTARKKLVAIG